MVLLGERPQSDRLLGGFVVTRRGRLCSAISSFKGLTRYLEPVHHIVEYIPFNNVCGTFPCPLLAVKAKA